MTNLFFSNSKLQLKLEEWEQEYSIKSKGVTVSLVGVLRTPKSEAEKYAKDILSSVAAVKKKESMLREVLHECFLNVYGDYFVLIRTRTETQIHLCYSCPQFYISSKDSKLVLSQDESYFKGSDFDKDRLLMRIYSNQGFYIPKGVFSDVTDALVSGMSLVLDNNKLNGKEKPYKTSWTIPFEKFCTSSAHEEAAQNIAESFVCEMKSYKNLKKKVLLQLSSGIDSALMLAAAKKAKLNVYPVTIRPGMRAGEIDGARKTARFLGYKLNEFVRGPTKDNTYFSAKTNITKYLEKLAPLLGTSSGMFILDNIELLLNTEYGFVPSLEGSAYPRALCIKHYAKYPTPLKPNFEPEVNSEKRHELSLDYYSSRVDEAPSDDVFDVAERFPDINPYYYEFLEMLFYSSTPRKLISYFPVLKMAPHMEEQIQELVTERGYEVLSMILLDEKFAKELETPSAITAMKLQKIILFITNITWASTKTFPYKKGNVLNYYRPGLNSRILMDFFEVIIDEKIEKYPKWHIFRAFEILTKKDFFEVTKIKNGFFKQFKEWFVLGVQVLQGIGNERMEMIANESVHRFLRKKNLVKEYEAIVDKAGLSDLVPDTTLPEKSSLKDPVPKFWYLNNIMNLSYLKK